MDEVNEVADRIDTSRECQRDSRHRHRVRISLTRLQIDRIHSREFDHEDERWFSGLAAAAATVVVLLTLDPVMAQMIDRTRAPNVANEGIAKSLAEQIGADRGDWATPDSSSYIIARDPFRADKPRTATVPAQVHAWKRDRGR